jgi:recombinational DNA repair ATPase RecF
MIDQAMPEVEMHPELWAAVEQHLQHLHLQPFNEETLRSWSSELSSVMARREEHLWETLGVRRTRLRARIVPNAAYGPHHVDLHFFVDGQRVLPMVAGAFERKTKAGP